MASCSNSCALNACAWDGPALKEIANTKLPKSWLRRVPTITCFPLSSKKKQETELKLSNHEEWPWMRTHGQARLRLLLDFCTWNGRWPYRCCRISVACCESQSSAETPSDWKKTKQRGFFCLGLLRFQSRIEGDLLSSARHSLPTKFVLCGAKTFFSLPDVGCSHHCSADKFTLRVSNVWCEKKNFFQKIPAISNIFFSNSASYSLGDWWDGRLNMSIRADRPKTYLWSKIWMRVKLRLSLDAKSFIPEFCVRLFSQKVLHKNILCPVGQVGPQDLTHLHTCPLSLRPSVTKMVKSHLLTKSVAKIGHISAIMRCRSAPFSKQDFFFQTGASGLRTAQLGGRNTCFLSVQLPSFCRKFNFHWHFPTRERAARWWFCAKKRNKTHTCKSIYTHVWSSDLGEMTVFWLF